jgi:hypothetical protein
MVRAVSHLIALASPKIEVTGYSSGELNYGEANMALYKFSNYLIKSDDNSFDMEYKPGAAPPHSGIYRCLGCGREVVAEESRQLPPQNHHEHSTTQVLFAGG